MTPLFSVIIPHHNIPNLLIRCLDSMPMRDDVQVIVVDDTSSAENLEKFNKIARKYSDKAYFYYTAEGKGGGAARNIGLDNAIGKYLLFVDADDFLLPSINEILDRYSDSNADIIFFNAVAKDSDTLEPSHRADLLRTIVSLHKEEPETAECMLRYQFGEPWCKMVKRDLILKNRIRFDELPIHNDTAFSYLAGYYASSLIVDETEGYCLTDRAGSVSKMISADKRRIRMEIFSRKNAFLRNHGINYFDPLIFAPLVIPLKQFQFGDFYDKLKIASSFGISKINLLKEYIKYKRSDFSSLY